MRWPQPGRRSLIGGSKAVGFTFDADFNLHGSIAKDIDAVVDDGSVESSLVEECGEEAGFVKYCATVAVEYGGGGSHGIVDMGKVDRVEVHIVYHPVADGFGISLAVCLLEAGEQGGCGGQRLLCNILGHGAALELNIVVGSDGHIGIVHSLLNIGLHLGVAVGVAHLVAFHGAVLLIVEAFDIEAAVAMNGVVEHDNAVVLKSGVDDGHFADAVESAAVGAFAGQLLYEGILRSDDLGAVGHDGVALIDSEGFKFGVVSDESLALVGIGGDGTVAEQLDLLAEIDVHAAVVVDGIAATDEVVLGIGLVLSHCHAGHECCYGDEK